MNHTKIIQLLISILFIAPISCSQKKDPEFLFFKLGSTAGDFGKDIELSNVTPSEINNSDTFKRYNYQKSVYLDKTLLNFVLFFKNDTLVQIVGFFSCIPKKDTVYQYILKKHGNPTTIRKVYDEFLKDSINIIEWHKKGYLISYKKESNSTINGEQQMRIYIQRFNNPH